MINTLTTLYSSLKSYYNNLIVYGHSYENRKLIILKGVLDVIKELRCYSYTSNQDITDIYSIVEYIVNSSDIFKKEYAPTNNITNYFQDVPSQFYPKGEYNIKESLVTVIANTTAFKYDGEGTVFPNEINLQAVAYNFTPSTNSARKWEYSNGGTYRIIEGATSDNLTVTPDSELWNNTDMISLRYTVNDIYTNQLTIFKVRDGYGAYSVEVTSSNGNIFQNNRIDTELSAHVYIAGSDITNTIPAEEFSWKRISDDPTSDTQWNNKNLKGKTIRITNKDVKKKATFVCTVVIDGAKIMNGQITIVDQLDTTYISATLESNKSLVRVETSGVTIQAIMLYPLGSIFKNDDVDFLKAHCDLWRGSYIDDIDVEYKWFIERPGVFDPKFTSLAAKTGDNVLHLDNTTGMVRDSNIRILGYDYVVATVNSSTTIVLTETLKQDVPSGTRIYNPYYNDKGGIGWAYIDEVNNFGVTGYTTNEITIPESTVLNFATFKCVITDLDSKSITYNQSVYATASFLDQQDPLQISFNTPEGTIFKNKTGTITIEAEVWRNGEELDEDGSTYIYDWIQYDKDGQIIPTFSRINKTILITPDDVDSKSNFEVRLKNSVGQVIAKGRITIVDIIDGSNSVIIYTRDMLEPSQPTGASPAGWNVYITYHDSELKPNKPTGNGTTNGWHTDTTDNVIWMSQKVAPSASSGEWGDPVKIIGVDGWYIDFKYALSENIPPIQYPNGKSPGTNWYDNPPQPSGNLYVWMTKILKNPITGEVKDGEQWSTPIKLTGDKGEDSYTVIADKEFHDILVGPGTKDTINPDYLDPNKLALSVSTTYTVLKGSKELIYRLQGGTTPGNNYYSIIAEPDEGLEVGISEKGQIYPTVFNTNKTYLSCKIRIYCEDSGINFLKVITWRKINEENWYLEDALGGVSVTDGGLFLTTWIRLGHAKKKNDFEYELTDEKAGIYGGKNLPGEYEPQTVRFYSGGNYESSQEWSNLYQEFLNGDKTPEKRQQFWKYDPRSQSPQGATFVIREDGQMLCYGGYFHGDIWADNGYFSGNIKATGSIIATGGKIGNLLINSDGSFGQQDGNFYVDPNGNLTAKNANINGNLSISVGGNIGNFKVQDNYLEFRIPDTVSGRELLIKIGKTTSNNFGVIMGKVYTGGDSYIGDYYSQGWLHTSLGGSENSYPTLRAWTLEAKNGGISSFTSSDCLLGCLRFDTQTKYLTSASKNIQVQNSYSVYIATSEGGDTLDGCTISGGYTGQIIFIMNHNESHRIGISKNSLYSNKNVWIPQKSGALFLKTVNGWMCVSAMSGDWG